MANRFRSWTHDFLKLESSGGRKRNRALLRTRLAEANLNNPLEGVTMRINGIVGLGKGFV